MYTITGQDWGDALPTQTAETKEEVVDIVFDIQRQHPGAILTIEGEGYHAQIDLADGFELFGEEYA